MVIRQIDVVVVTYKDRLTRFGFEYLEYFFRLYGARVKVAWGRSLEMPTKSWSRT